MLGKRTKTTDAEETFSNETFVSLFAPERWVHENKAMRDLVRNIEGGSAWFHPGNKFMARLSASSNLELEFRNEIVVIRNAFTHFYLNWTTNSDFLNNRTDGQFDYIVGILPKWNKLKWADPKCFYENILKAHDKIEAFYFKILTILAKIHSN